MSVVINSLQMDENLNRLLAFRKSDDFDWQLAAYSKIHEIILKDADTVESANINFRISSWQSSALVAAMLLAQQQLNGVAAIPAENFHNYSKWMLGTGSLNSLQQSGRIQFSQVDIKPIDLDEESKAESADKAELEKIFNGLAKKWKDETGGSSLTMRRYAHSSYQSILVLGGKEPKVVTLILQELQRRPDMWFEALRRLTNEDPAKNAKSFEDSTKAWLKWGQDKQLIS
ncbi:MAG TPA: hypothetical protein VGH42_10570 [Verrucomicrobiae bacterium]|jgi:hypothetical protein